LIIIFIVYCLVLLLLTVFKSAEMYLPAIHQLQAWLGGDKLMHLKLSLLLSLFACIAGRRLKILGSLKLPGQLFCIQLFLVTALLLDESHQYLTHSRRFEWLDFSYGVLGLFIGLNIYGLLVVLKHYFTTTLGWRRR